MTLQIGAIPRTESICDTNYYHCDGVPRHLRRHNNPPDVESGSNPTQETGPQIHHPPPSSAAKHGKDGGEGHNRHGGPRHGCYPGTIWAAWQYHTREKREKDESVQRVCHVKAIKTRTCSTTPYYNTRRPPTPSAIRRAYAARHRRCIRPRVSGQLNPAADATTQNTNDKVREQGYGAYLPPDELRERNRRSRTAGSAA